jgi:HK97 family phage major capsid protein
MRLNDLLEARARAVTQMRAFADAIDRETRDYSEDEDKRHNELKAEIAGLDQKIQRARDLQEAERSAPAIISRGNLGDGTYETRAREFSLVKAILASCGDIPHDGLEREFSTELRSRTGRRFSGVAVPDQAFETRTLTIGSGAADLYQVQHRPDQFVDLRRSAMVTATLGATTLSGLIGDQSIPRQISSSTAQHVAEDGALTETDAGFDDVELTPKTVGAMTSFSRRALLNAQPSVEALVRADLAAVIGRAVDFQALFGNGSGNTPVGVANETGVFAATLATPSWGEVLAFVASIESADADFGTMGWTMNPNAVAKLRSTTKVSSDAGAGFLMDSPTEMAGFRVVPTTGIQDIGSPVFDRQVIFGAWSSLLIGLWSGIDLLSNPFSDTAFPRGRVQVRGLQDYDCAVRHGQSFAIASDLPVP